ncbi:MAG: FAD-binding protein, partial [Geminicoccaceae bacterium]
MSELHPTTEAEASELIRAAATDKTSLSLVGGGTRFALGRPMQTEKTLTSRKLTGITLYEPTEMIMAARAGTPLAEIQSALDEKNQMLAFEPMDHRRILGTDGEPTVGGMAAGNISGPRRLFGGAARDSLVGTRFVNGRGEIIKNGGRVMKNVTGLDLVRLLAGSWGTLGFLTEVTFKVQPRAPASMTLAIPDLGDADAVRLLCKAVGSPFEITGACHLPAGVGVDHGRTIITIEGYPDSQANRKTRLAELLSTSGEMTVVDV